MLASQPSSHDSTLGMVNAVHRQYSHGSLGGSGQHGRLLNARLDEVPHLAGRVQHILALHSARGGQA